MQAQAPSERSQVVATLILSHYSSTGMRSRINVARRQSNVNNKYDVVTEGTDCQFLGERVVGTCTIYIYYICIIYSMCRSR